jgi:hypothetical protein
MPERGAPRAVIVVSSHVARGSVGNRAAVFALETLGFPIWAVPTVILPWHPGHGRITVGTAQTRKPSVSSAKTAARLPTDPRATWLETTMTAPGASRSGMAQAAMRQ